MKIGLLKCDTIRPILSSIMGDYDRMVPEAFKVVDKDITWKIYDVVQLKYPKLWDECDAYLITGSKSSAFDDDPWIRLLKEKVREMNQQKIKLFAICFGHQVVADALGGKITRSDKGWGIGCQTWQVVKQRPWMQPALSEFSLLASHQDQVTSLPENATLLASSDFCPYAMYQVNNHILCLQGHPEFPKEYANALYLSHKGRYEPEALEQALHSLEKHPQDMACLTWALKFLKTE
jgi:GMP synthase-like glutamine amidotransferase